jgi:hypothetical protein
MEQIKLQARHSASAGVKWRKAGAALRPLIEASTKGRFAPRPASRPIILNDTWFLKISKIAIAGLTMPIL